MEEADTIVLWRPVGPEELELIRTAESKGFPPRLPDKPFFYPVLTQEYARKIARDWNVPRSGKGYVTQFRVRRAFLDKYSIRQVGGRDHSEYWIPADELDQFNSAIVGEIEVVEEFLSGPLSVAE